MAVIRHVMAPGLLVRTRAALGMTQKELGALLGCSRRTVIRLEASDGSPTFAQWVTLARAAYPIHRAAALEIANAIEETLASLDLERPPRPPPPPEKPRPTAHELADSVVCAASEAAASAPQTIRPALLAGLDRAASLGMTLDDIRAALRASTP